MSGDAIDGLTGRAAPEVIRGVMVAAAHELASMAAEAESLRALFEARDWSGLGAIRSVCEAIAAACEVLVEIAERIGVGGAIVRAACAATPDVGDKSSLFGDDRDAGQGVSTAAPPVASKVAPGWRERADQLEATLDSVVADEADGGEAPDDDWEARGDAATWDPRRDVGDEPVIQFGPAPKMVHSPWFESQGVKLGQAEAGEHYWRCPVRKCDAWAGPYTDVMVGKKAGMDHRYRAHDLPAARRTEALKSARRLGGKEMVAVKFDPIVERVAQAHAVPNETVHLIVYRIDSVIAGRSHADWMVDAIVQDGLMRNPDTARALVLDIAEELGHADRLRKLQV